MGTLIVNFVGVNAYVPHTTDNKLLVVMPNASKLGKSPQGALDGTPLVAHLPFLWERVDASGGTGTLEKPRLFLGSRVSLSFSGSPGGLNTSAIDANANAGWLGIDTNLLRPQHDDRLAAQVLLEQGTVVEYAPSGGSCTKSWYENSSWSIDPVLSGLRVQIDNVSGVTATAFRWLDGEHKSLYQRQLGETEEVVLFMGNVCAGNALEWPVNASETDGWTRDEDFKWLYRLSADQDIQRMSRLPVPKVEGSGLHAEVNIPTAFAETWGGGGGAACECNGCADEPKAFS